MARAGAGVEHLPACVTKPSSSLERWLGWAGQVGLLGEHQVILYSLCFLFFFLFIPVLCFETVKYYSI